MASNFDFLQKRYPGLFQHAKEAESLVYTAPRASCFYCRFTLEQAVHWLYAYDANLQLPYDNNLGTLIHEQTFQNNLKPGLFAKVRAIHKMGNIAVHRSTTITEKDSLHLVEELFHFLYWLSRSYSEDIKNHPAVNFDRDLIPCATQPNISDLSVEQLQALETQLSLSEEMRRIAEARQQQTEAELTALKGKMATLKQQNLAVPDTHNYNEAATRHYLIDVLLKEAGWNINQSGCTEYEVEGMPNDTGRGRVDYVLWGDDGKPLAVVEAKRTRKSPETGRHQAKLYADCLEARFQQRPVIFYTNGYKYWIWDDVSYPPREIEGFLKKDELERLIFRRTHRKRLHLVNINPAIVERSYQTLAIRSITEAFDDRKERKALLVMATGTGKTRTAIALVDLLMRANWVKRVLFLADRNALITQALRAFKSHLPTATAVDITKYEATPTDNVVLSTYPTMLNRINRNDGDKRIFGPGHFDLIIVDEAHRSIYHKYRAIFDYFDGLLVGLTATPRDEVHRDTYRIFDLEAGVPTFAYELRDAIADGYLVPGRGVQVPFRFLRTGIRYADLSPAEQEEYEDRFRDEETGAIPDKINAAALNDWLFNISTVDQALELLMQRGLKVEGGDRLGKTIIFARNQKHAEFIVQRFNLNYPHYRGEFAQVIHSEITYNQSLIDDFSEAHKQPTIAVSVDMLDTGIDVPEVVNLVFFKPVYSLVKFNQMIGRGTRLCRDLFGVDNHKTEFLVFDLCSNFDYFNQQIAESEQKPSDSITTKLVRTRLELSELLRRETNNPEPNQLRSRLLDDLHQHVATMARDNFLVRRHLQQVEEFSERSRWDNLNNADIDNIAQSLAPLPNGLPQENHPAKRFDLLCLKLQIAVMNKSQDFIKLRDQVRDLLHQLEEKQTIPMVKAKLALIEDIQTETWWLDITPEIIEQMRHQLRDLVKFIDPKKQVIVYTDFEDKLGEVTEANIPMRQTGFSPYQYRKKVEAYIREHENQIAIAKLKRNVPLTDADLASLEELLFNAEAVESRERFEEVYGKNLKLFIRQLVGLDRNAAKQAFAKYLEGSNFNATQIRFVNTIIDYLTQNGVMDAGLLYEPPFTDLHYEGLDGVFEPDDADQIISIVSSFNAMVGKEFGAA
ncbi:DEAD/DEAH box helicase family protein [Anabaena sp. CA = ATCC 33047]|uniref:DEAD/DEAH box helicase family protein n=1 Tax=Anabaena sp. (strain CA / ATCC 33047) TaxID=52271 RepID=UPI00082B113D|nr:DEAD/DEAH box helicase family protein [Anabaena sp. CA = ATCC 33047]